MVYHRPGADVIGSVGGAHPLPLQALVDFDRVSVAAGEPDPLPVLQPTPPLCAGGSAPVSFSLNSSIALSFVNENGASVLYPGTHYLDVANGNGANFTIPLTVVAGSALVIRAPPLP